MHVQCCRIFNGFGNNPKANSIKQRWDEKWSYSEQNGVFVASVEHSDDDCKDFFFFLNLRIPLQISDCWKSLAKGSQKFWESKILKP